MACLLRAATRDLAVFAEPDRLEIRRERVTPLSFGGAIHFCLGRNFARIEAQEAFGGLLRRLPTMELPERDTSSRRWTFNLRGLTTLPAAWKKLTYAIWRGATAPTEWLFKWVRA